MLKVNYVYRLKTVPSASELWMKMEDTKSQSGSASGCPKKLLRIGFEPMPATTLLCCQLTLTFEEIKQNKITDKKY